MYAFPSASNLQFLVGKELDQIALGSWQIQFNFDAGRIHVEHTIEHVDSDGTVHRHNTDEDRLAPLFLHHLIGQAISGVSVDPFCLTVAFGRGDLLRIFSEDGPYECGQIYDDKGELFVF